MPLTLQPQPLSAAAFAPYGTVIEAPTGGPSRPINGGTSQRFDLVGDLALTAQGGRPLLALFRAQARRFPHAVTELERHALGSQSFVPLGRRRFVIVVAASGDAPQPQALAAFVSNGEQGVVLAPGTWHHALLAVDAGDFVVVERAADCVDCDVCDLPAAVSVVLG
ncbi:ureidoglycolate lyase [Pseudorhodoferax sp. Leaf267]|uniref:ureidoglycolate lyase n=1 Tax=Pseudorhodoferax sp. Leaf267 TaxID=1736316 RepID=UPI0006F1E507|nr:ureidoglycolate lyase [Pseudorhodoferax sp. Leaf267]KQP14086.1 ureidoglycolate hydrolase [Pseudorhodoferax sp. Leaf267]